MATSLAKQLKKLEVPQTQSLQVVGRLHASFLFDRNTHLDRETVFAIGINGLEELECVLPEFQKFRATLFNESSMSFERSVQTEEINTKLDNEVGVFLRLLSPFLLLKPAHKALEWLVQRFHVHLYNVDELVKCALPYHDTKVFVRVIQLLDLKQSAKSWQWLANCQTSGSPLSKLTLYNRCYNYVDFLAVICRLASDSTKVEVLRSKGFLRTVVLFYMSSALGALERNDGESEVLLTTLLPYLLTGVKSECRDYVCASYVIVSQLARKMTIVADVWNPLLEAICLHPPDDLLNEALSCVAIVCDSQKLKKLSKKCCRRLLNERVRASVAELSHRYSVFPLVDLLVRYQLRDVFQFLASSVGSPKTNPVKTQSVVSGPIETFYWIVQNVRLTNDEIKHSLGILFHTYLKKAPNGRNRQQQATVEMMEELGKRFSGDFDELLDELLSTSTIITYKVKTTELIEAFQMKPKVLSMGSNRFLALHHPNVARRRLAVVEMTKSDCLDLDNDSYWKLMEERLNDDYPSVVAAVLKCKRLSTCVSSDELVVSLIRILEKNVDNKDWKDVRKLCLRQIAKIDDMKNVSAATMHSLHLCLLPMLFPTEDSVSNTEMVLALDVPFFFTIREEVQSSDCLDADKLCNLMPCWVAAAIVKMPSSQKIQFVESLTDEGSCLMFAGKLFRKVFLLWLYGEIISAEPGPFLKVKFACLVLGCARKRQKKKSVRKSEIPPNELENLTAHISRASHFGRDKQQLSSLLLCLANVISSLKLPKEMSALNWFDVHESQNELTILLLRAHTEVFKILLYGSSHSVTSATSVAFSLLLKMWKNECFTRVDDFLKLLAFLLTFDAHADKDSVVMHVHALQTIEAISKFVTVEKLLNSTNLVPGLLVASTSTIDVVRSAALACVSVISQKTKPNEKYERLLSTIASHKAEIAEDGSLLQSLLSSYFLSEEAYSTKELKSFLALIVGNGTNGRHPLPYCMQNGLLFYLEEVDKPEVLLQLLPILSNVMETNNRTADQHEIATNITRKFTPVTAQMFAASPHSFTVFLDTLHNCNFSRLADLPSLQMTLLSRITKQFFAAIQKDDFQQTLLQNLVDLQVENDNHVAVQKLAKVLRKLMLDGRQIKHELMRTARPVANVHLLKDVKRLKSKVVDETSEHFVRKRTTIILEALQGRKNVSHCQLLVPTLFAVLKRCLESGDPLTAEYDKQLVLSSLFNSVSQMNTDDPGFGQDQFNVELVVHCIRSSTSPKTHQEALFLLALAAKIFPDHVMHNTMAIFTFMGQNISRHDDSSSFSVIISTMEAIVPAIMERSRMSTNVDKSEEETACSLTRVFVDALPDIPEHRRIPLFSCLVSALGPDGFLWPTVALILEKLITFNKKTESSKNFERRPILEFAVQLSHRYSPLSQITSCEKLLSYIIQLKDVDEQKGVVGHLKKSVHIEKSTDMITVQRHTPKLRCHFKLLVTEYVSTLLSSRPFLTQVVELQPEQTELMRTSYQILLENILTSAHHIAHRMEKSADSQLMKYWKVLQHRTYELLDKLSSLLPSSLFINVIDELMKDSKPLVRRKALEILATKLQHPGHQLDPTNHNSLAKLVPTLLNIVQSNEVDERFNLNGDNTVEISSNRQTALLTLKHICRILGSARPELFETVLNVATAVVRDESMVDHVRAGALLYMAEHCQTLKSQSIPHLATFVPALLTVLEDLDRVIRNELLLLSVVTALHKIVEKVCQFLSPYLECILEKVCRLSTLSPKNPKSPLVVRLATIRYNISTTVSPRILIPAVESCFSLFCRVHHESIQPLMQTLREYVTHTDKEELALWHGPLFNFFLSTLNYRTEHQDNEEHVLEIETSIMEPMLATILKMSEATFRPFFIKLFDWAVRGDGPTDRVLTFYRVVDRIADQLKSLFVLFAGHLIRNAATLLDQNNPSKTDNTYSEDAEARKRETLVHYILDCLHKCFLYDNERFVNKERFDTLLQPLVDQIENDSTNYEDHICNHLAPCLAQLAVAAANESLWKPLNYQVLLKTRHQAPKVRFGALQVLREMAKGIGEEYIGLLPETIPFLAELMEDENLEVEQLCQAVVADMEVILGEPLQKYF